MKLIIDIPEEKYNEYKRIGDSRDILFEAIRNCTPLPEGHGRLIDADALIKEKSYCTAICLRDACDNCQYKCVAKYDITNAPTIIEADKAESEEI